MKAYRGRRGTAPLILNLTVVGGEWLIHFSGNKPVSIQYAPGRDSETAKSFWREEKLFIPTGIGTRDR